MSLPTEVAQQQINLSQYPEKFRQPFLDVLRDKELKLFGKNINASSSFNMLFLFLKDHPIIITLNVNGNQIGGAGAEALARNTYPGHFG